MDAALTVLTWILRFIASFPPLVIGLSAVSAVLLAAMSATIFDSPLARLGNCLTLFVAGLYVWQLLLTH
jgi:hypothetical protein